MSSVLLYYLVSVGCRPEQQGFRVLNGWAITIISHSLTKPVSWLKCGTPQVKWTFTAADANSSSSRAGQTNPPQICLLLKATLSVNTDLNKTLPGFELLFYCPCKRRRPGWWIIGRSRSWWVVSTMPNRLLIFLGRCRASLELSIHHCHKTSHPKFPKGLSF